MKIASWNVNSLKVRLPQVLDWLAEARPDLLALQETKLTDDKFPAGEIQEAGYQVIHAGQKTYNGVAVLSRLKQPARDIVCEIPGFPDPQRRVLAASYGKLRLINLYVPNGAEVGSEKYDYKLAWLHKLGTWLKKELAAHPQLVVLGDFNIAPEDRDVHDPLAWEGSVLVSAEERKALQKLCKTGLADTFRLFDQEEKVFSWWDYRMMAFRRNHGLRIDLVLCSETLAKKCTASYVDKAPRRLERPSDHAPVIAEFGIKS